MYCIEWICSPSKRSMAMYEYCRYIIWFFVFKCLYDDISCFQFILSSNFFFAHLSCTWYLTIEVVSMCRSHRFYTYPSLSKANCPFTMGMYDTTDMWEVTIQHEMCICIGRWLVFTFYLFTCFYVYDDHIFWF